MFHFAVVGGGIVGLSTAWSLGRRYPNATILMLEKEVEWAKHQTGHNSGVIHSGIYYKPGSLKARFARDGGAALMKLCQNYDIDYEVCGKVMVATEPCELPILKDLYERGLRNELEVEMIDSEKLKTLEPYASGIAALRVPSTGIVDYARVAKTMATIVEEQGATLQLNTEVINVSESEDKVEIDTNNGQFSARMLVNCAGLQSDRIAALCGVESGVKIVPFRGEYYELKPERRYLVKNLIYPVPNPSFPFLGVHFTRAIDGSVEAGPNAVLGFAREGYSKTDVNLGDLAEIFTYPAFWKLASSYWRTGLGEIVRSLSKKAFVKSLKKLVPEVEESDLIPISAGVRAQALTKDGGLVDDFLIVDGERSVHVLNAPSPAATAAIPIGDAVVEQIAGRKDL